jgi:hypothetical protein
MNRYTWTNERWYNKISWTCLQVLFESLFCLTQFLNMAMVRNFEVMAEQLCVEFCNFVKCHIFVNYLTFAVNE